jgi:hypothetical protein
MLKRSLLAGALALALTASAFAQTYKDSNGTVVQGVASAGSKGADYSANQPALPNVGANFGGSGPYAGYVLISTVPSSPARFSIDVENNGGAQIAILLDDGTAANGAAPVNATVFALAGGSGTGSQGGSWVSLVEKGRVQVYAASASAQVAVRQN